MRAEVKQKIGARSIVNDGRRTRTSTDDADADSIWNADADRPSARPGGNLYDVAVHRLVRWPIDDTVHIALIAGRGRVGSFRPQGGREYAQKKRKQKSLWSCLHSNAF